MERKAFNDLYADWIVKKIESDFADDVSLALIYGSYINGTAGCKSDVDCYFIPKAERGYFLARTFLFDGVGYDLFPMSWERVEGIASLEGGLPPLLGDVQILFCNSPEDKARFEELQELLKRNLRDDGYVQSIAEKKCLLAAEECAQMSESLALHQLRRIAGSVIMTLADAVAIYNHDYYHRGTKMQYTDLLNRFPGVPAEIAGYYRQTAESIHKEEIIRSATGMLEAVCRYMGLPCRIPAAPEKKAATVGALDAAQLAGLYEEISATFQKIYLCCETGNHILGFLSGVVLQNELDFAMELGCPAMDVLSDYDPNALPCFAAAVREAEADLVSLITHGGGHLRHYHSFAEFAAQN